MVKPAKNTICLWYDGDAEEAARFYAKTFPDSSVGAVHRAPGDFPSGKKGDVLTVEFTVMGVACLGLNGGPAFKHNEAFSFQVATADQAETDRYWNAIVGNGGQESACGWCKDKWGLSWQITPIVLTEAITDPDATAAKRKIPDYALGVDYQSNIRGGSKKTRRSPRIEVAQGLHRGVELLHRLHRRIRLRWLKPPLGRLATRHEQGMQTVCLKDRMPTVHRHGVGADPHGVFGVINKDAPANDDREVFVA